MPKHKDSISIVGIIAPVRALFVRLSILFIIVFSISIIFINKTNIISSERLHTAVMDITVPVLNVLARPIDAYNNVQNKIHNMIFVYEENERLQRENKRLHNVRTVMVGLEVENKRLRQLLNVPLENTPSFVTTRVVGAPSMPYRHTVVLNAGSAQGVRQGQGVRNEKGLVGRILNVGKHSSRVILVTDIESNIPVISSESGESAILSGTNADRPILKHLPSESLLSEGEVMLTSGDGKLFPADIPVGIVGNVSHQNISVTPFVAKEKLGHVIVVGRVQP